LKQEMTLEELANHFRQLERNEIIAKIQRVMCEPDDRVRPRLAQLIMELEGWSKIEKDTF